MNSVPLVSAIITTHNRLDLLKRAINSVLSQTYKNIECIVISDNSTDGTDEYCNSLEGVKYISIPASDSRGANYARNVGVNISKGHYIAFLDDDDYWLPEKIAMQVSLLTREGYGLVSCGRFLEVVENDSARLVEAEIGNMASSDMSKKSLYRFIALSSLVLIDRKILLAIGGFDENLSIWQDYELIIRLSQITQLGSVPNRLVVYRENSSDKNKASNNFNKWKIAVEYIYNKHQTLYNNLTFREKLEVKHLYYSDGHKRAKKNGMPFTALWYARNRNFYRRASKILNFIGVK